MTWAAAILFAACALNAATLYMNHMSMKESRKRLALLREEADRREAAIARIHATLSGGPS